MPPFGTEKWSGSWTISSSVSQSITICYGNDLTKSLILSPNWYPVPIGLPRTLVIIMNFSDFTKSHQYCTIIQEVLLYELQRTYIWELLTKQNPLLKEKSLIIN